MCPTTAPAPARPGSKLGGMPGGRGFGPPASGCLAGILTGFREKLGRPAGRLRSGEEGQKGGARADKISRGKRYDACPDVAE